MFTSFYALLFNTNYIQFIFLPFHVLRLSLSPTSQLSRMENEDCYVTFVYA